jgi:glucose/arabinose dehydrogenase/cytochrome c5
MTSQRPIAMSRLRLLLLAAPLLIAGGLVLRSASAAPDPATCPGDNGGLSLPPGFCATVFADNLGHTRHLVVAGDGTVYVNTWSGRYFRNAPPAPAGGFVVALRDRDGDGVADSTERFGPGEAQGGHGGTGIALWHGGLFVEEGDTIVRYPVKPDEPGPAGPPTTILSGMPLTGDHPMHPFAITADGTLLVNSGSATNTCESPNRKPGAKGAVPCTELETRAGIWAYRADKPGQVFSPAERWATGIRNTGGISFDQSGRVFGVQHGRDQLSQNWPALYTTEQGVERPAEILFAPFKGADFGWPRCYYDGFQHRHVLAPEYGGDGGKTQGICAKATPPVAAFPAHWAPNDMTIYTGHAFPAAYAQGAFIAFHGSWNRAPAPQDGYLVAFQPLKDGKASGPWIRFADGFAGAYKEPGRALHRPAGLAVGPDGALYIADDVRGRIWRVTYHGPMGAALTNAPKAEAAGVAAASATALPPGMTAQQIALGRAIYLGEARGGTCVGCHGSDGRGSMAGGSLVGPVYLWSDGSVEGLAATITRGVSQPKKASGAMPAMGGVALSPDDVRAVAGYVWTLGHTG